MTASERTLQRTLGLRDAVVIGVGSMVGAGVFAVWAPAAAAAGGGLLIGLGLAAIVAFCNATSSAQLAAIHAESGGTYVYARYQLGPAWGHLAGWGFVIGKTASCAAMAMTVGVYLWPDQTRLVAVLAVAGIVVVNIGGMSRTVAVTRGLLAISMIALAVVVVAGWSNGDTAIDRVDVTGGGVGGVLRSAGFIFFAFAGYARIATLGEEVREPRRIIPRAIVGALTGVVVIYAVVAVTALAAVPAADIAATDAPLRLVVERSRLDALGPLTRVGAGIAALGVLLNLIPGISRTVLAMARRRELPSLFAVIDDNRSLPLRAELTVAAVVAALVLAIDLRDAIGFSSVAVLTYYALTNASSLRLDRHQRRFPVPLAVGGLIGCVVLAASLPRATVIAGVAFLLAGVLIRLITIRIAPGTSPTSGRSA